MRAVLLVALGALACGSPESRGKPLEVGTAACPGPALTEEVTFQAEDGHELHGTWKNPCGVGVRPAVVLVHQMCKDRAEWRATPHDWVELLARRGIASLAFDLRGHGASKDFVDGSTHDLCKESSDRTVAARYAGVVEDVKGAVDYVRNVRGASAVALVGSSIGANSALVAFAADPDLVALVALSPGLDYHGIRTEEPAKAVGGRAVLLFAARADKASAAAVDALKAKNPKLNTKIWPEGGHGNALLVAHPEVLDRLVDFLATRLDRK